mmetsp:Transcript_35409/g.81681  ORF Transcript_35409/g.81681 Transcript_35409/m.81681 type:complete len:219 (+) Transcript_35409:581-1237(+)
MPAQSLLLRVLKLLKDDQSLLHVRAGLLHVGLELAVVLSDLGVRKGNAALITHVLEDAQGLLVVLHGLRCILHGVVGIPNGRQGSCLAFAAAKDTAQGGSIAALVERTVLSFLVVDTEASLTACAGIANCGLALLEVAELVAESPGLAHRGKGLLSVLSSQLGLHDQSFRQLAQRQHFQAIVGSSLGCVGKRFSTPTSFLCRASGCKDLLQIPRHHPC